MGEFLTVTDVAKRYSISRSSVFNFYKKGLIPKGITFGKTRRWSLEELEAFEQGKREKEVQ